MTRNLIHNTVGGYSLVSHGKGLAYELTAPLGESLFLQGDDANDFRQELDDLTGPTGLQLHMQDALDAIWHNYH